MELADIQISERGKHYVDIVWEDDDNNVVLIQTISSKDAWEIARFCMDKISYGAELKAERLKML